MGFFYRVSPDDEQEYAALIEQFTARRRQLRLAAKNVGVAMGGSVELVAQLEGRARDSQRVSTLQLWAGVLEAQLVLEVQGLWDDPVAAQDKQMMAWWRLSQLPGASDRWIRLWLVAALRAWRIAHGISAHEVAQALGKTSGGILRWEGTAFDPLLKRAMAQALVTGTRVRVRLEHD